MEEIKNGVSRKLFGLQTEGRRPPRTGQLIVKDGKLLGEVTSGNYSPTLECGIAIALLDPKVSLGEKVTIQGRRNEEEATIVKLPFYIAAKKILKGNLQLTAEEGHRPKLGNPCFDHGYRTGKHARIMASFCL